MKKMKLSDISIKSSFAESTPREEKMQECRENWLKKHCQDRYIVVDHTNTLIDGYVQYLVLKENNVPEADVIISDKRRMKWHRKIHDMPLYRTEETTYVYGVHPNNVRNKEFVWRIPKSWGDFEEKLCDGDRIVCSTRFGPKQIIVTRVERTKECPVDFIVRKVARKNIIRNGLFIAMEG